MSHSIQGPSSDPHVFTEEARQAIYEAIFRRRDVRGQFLPTVIPDDVLSRVLTAAHHAPSVGFMQPWNFLIVRSPEVKQQVHAVFTKAHAEAAAMFSDQRQQVYQALKLEGIREAPIGICITCDRERTGPVVIGRTHMKTMDLYSSVCAVQNLWLAARSEGLGVGWVSIFNPDALQLALGIPSHIVPIAYLCVGFVSQFYEKPELETVGWLKRMPIENVVYFDQWGYQESDNPLIGQLQRDQQEAEQTGSLDCGNSNSSGPQDPQ